jgi:hypothetical protein
MLLPIGLCVGLGLLFSYSFLPSLTAEQVQPLTSEQAQAILELKRVLILSKSTAIYISGNDISQLNITLLREIVYKSIEALTNNIYSKITKFRELIS